MSGEAATSGAAEPRRHGPAVRTVVAGVVGLAVVLVLLRARSEAHHAAGILPTLRRADPGRLLAAASLEALSYVLPGIGLRLMAPELRPRRALQITLAALGVGPLLPGSPLTGSGIAFAELRREGAGSAAAAARAAALVIAVPAASMALLAGPALAASGALTPLPAGWKGVVIFAGAGALGLGGAIAAAVAGVWASPRIQRPLELAGGRAVASRLLALGAAAWICDAGCLWLTGSALHVNLPPGSLPMAYIAAIAIASLPVLPGGLGAVEATVPAIFAAGGGVYLSALVAVIAWRVLAFWIPTAAGGLALASLHRRRSAPAVGITP